METEEIRRIYINIPESIGNGCWRSSKAPLHSALYPKINVYLLNLITGCQSGGSGSIPSGLNSTEPFILSSPVGIRVAIAGEENAYVGHTASH